MSKPRLNFRQQKKMVGTKPRTFYRDRRWGQIVMKHTDSETLKALKDKAETDPMKAVDELLERVLAGAGAKSGKLDGPQEAT